MLKNLIAWSCAGVVATTAVGQPNIDRLAPDDSFLVVSVDNLKETRERFQRTSLWSLWKSDQVQGMLSETIEEFNTRMQELCEDLGVEEGQMVLPDGAVGFAMFPGQPPNDFEDEPSPPGFLLIADYGAGAFKFGRVVDAALERMDEEGAEFEVNEVMGRTVYTFELADLDLDDMIEVAEMDFEGMPADMDPMDIVGDMGQVHFLRDGTRFMLSSDLDAMRGALEVVEGDERASIADRDDFLAARSQIGRSDGYAVLMIDSLVQALAGDDPMGMMVQAMIQSIVGDIRAVSFGVRFDTANSMVEESFGLYMPDGPQGLTALIDTESPRRDPPSFVGPKAVGYTSMNFEFAGIPGLLRNIAQTNPMIGMQLNEMLMQNGAMIEQVCGALGPEVHVVVTLSQPIDLMSLKTLYAISSSQPDQVEAVLAQFAPQMGVEPRDFLGNRIYTLPIDPQMLAMGGPMMAGAGGDGFSIGFASGYVMLGTTGLVEDALRATGRKDLPTLSDDPDFARAMHVLDEQRTVGWGVVNILDYLAYFKDFEALMQEQMIEQMKQWDAEYAQEMQAEFDAQPAPPWRDFDLETLKRYIGPASWQMRAREDGFVGTYYLLAPKVDMSMTTE